MDPHSALPLLVPLPRPATGSATRVALGRHEVVLEAVRGGYALLWTDGKTARRHVLALPANGHLTVQLRAPRATVHVATRDVMVLLPGARCHGFVQVPLIPTIVWHDAAAVSHVVVELRPAELAAEWDEEHGHTLHCSSAWHTRFPLRADDPRVVVALHLRNCGRETLSPASLPITVSDDELLHKRGSIVVRPRRLWWNGRWQEVRATGRVLGVPA